MSIKQMSKEQRTKSKARGASWIHLPFAHCSLLIALFYLLIAHCSLLFAQEEETRFIQRLTWTGDEYARRYEVVIEREEGGAYRELRREFTTELFIDVPLLLGKYRCLVIPYNFLDIAGEASPWVHFEVLAALNPELDLILGFVPSDTKSKTAPLDIFLSAAWMPSFAIYDAKDDRFFGRDISLAGTVIRFGVALSENFFGFNPGLELAASYNFMNADSGGRAHLWGIGLNFLVLKQLPGDKMALNFRLGAGYSIHFQVNMGVSFMLFVIDHLYLETGLDYAHWFTGKDMHPSSFRPWIGIGYRK